MDDFVFELVEFESALPWIYAEEDEDHADLTIHLEMVIEVLDGEASRGEAPTEETS